MKYFFILISLLTTALSSQVNAQEVCQIDGQVVGALASRNGITTVSPVSPNMSENLPADFEPQELSPIPYQWITPVFRDQMSMEHEYEYMREDVLKATIAMLDDAQKDGIEIFVHSAYRPYKTQCSVFTKKVRKELQTPGLKLLEAIAKVNTRSARPGQSEHQLGTAVDFVTNIPDLGYKLEYHMESTPAFAWLAKNAYRYGFIMSFPKEMTLDFSRPNPRTGYIFEPWHWRYVHPHFSYRFKKCENRLTPIEFLRALARNPQFNCH